MDRQTGRATHPHDLSVAAGTGRSEELLVAVLTVDVVLFLHEADVSQRHVAVVTVKLLGVPGPTESHQEGTPRNKNNVIRRHESTRVIKTSDGRDLKSPRGMKKVHLISDSVDSDQL